MNYNALTRRHFAAASHAGVLTGPNTRRGAAGSRASGTWVQFDLQFAQQGGSEEVLRAVRFAAFGCPHVIAVADWIAQQATDLPAPWRFPESIAALKLRFEVPTEKLGRLLVVEDAWIAATSPPSKPG